MGCGWSKVSDDDQIPRPSSNSNSVANSNSNSTTALLTQDGDLSRSFNQTPSEKTLARIKKQLENKRIHVSKTVLREYSQIFSFASEDDAKRVDALIAKGCPPVNNTT
eukprot:TRINITY_DN29339_c0_g1_i1.p2 TRINITY_DN29339_c0_g1~~TRINITY_DN29339_c0_g1_i1.p2  ORF type:complete len:108 (+),score=27.99 TRINITY_DN29339_c0_g1_i1:66-389(+)